MGILQWPPAVRPTVMLSPPKPLYRIQPNLVCELLAWMGCATVKKNCLAHWSPGEGPKGLSLCLSVCLSVCSSRYLLLNHWTKSNQILYVSCSHEWGMQRHNFFLALPPGALGPGEGQKRSNIIKFQLQSQFQRFLNQTLCAF